MRTRVLYVLDCYPQLSETYIKTEIEAVRDDYELRVLVFRGANLPCQHYQPFEHVDDAICRTAASPKKALGARSNHG